MHWLLPSIIAALSGSAILVWVYAFLHFQYRERHTGLWAWAWAFHTLRFIFEFGMLRQGPGSEFPHLIQLSVLVSGLFLLWGTSVFVRKRVSPYWIAASLAAAAWIFCGHLFGVSFLLQTLPVFSLYGAISIWTGVLFLRSKDIGPSGRFLAGWPLILWGIHKADYPFLRSLEGFAPYGYLIGAVLSFVVAVGMLLVYFQKVRRDLLEREEALRQSDRKFRAIFDETFQLSGLLSADGTLLEANRTSLDMVGAEAEGVLGMPIWETPWWTHSAEQRELLQDAVEEAAAGRFVRFEAKHHTANGRLREIDFSLKPIFDEGGAVALLIAEGRDITERKDAEEALREKSILLQTILNAIPSPTFYKDEEGAFLGCNAAFEKFIGRPWDRIVGKTAEEFFPEDLAEAEALADGTLLSRGGPQAYETALTYPDGSRHEVILHRDLFRKKDGSIGGIVGSALDITDRKQAEKELQASQERWKFALEGSGDAIWDRNVMTGEVFFSRRWKEMLGYAEDEILNLFEEWERRVHPEEQWDLWTQINRHLRGETPYFSVENRLRCKDGSHKWILTRGRVVTFTADGRPLRMVGTQSDISGRRESEKALRESEKRHKTLSSEFQALLNGIPDALMLLSPEMEIVWANQGAADHMGQGLDALEGRHCHEFWHGRDTLCEDCVAKRSFLSGDSEEDLVQTADGRSWGVKTFPIKDGAEKVVNVIHMATDITEKTRLRAEATRSSRLASLGELSAGVAHEINNPNGLVLMNLETLKEVFADAEPILEAHYEREGDFRFGGLSFSRMRREIPEMLEEIHDGARRIRRIVEDLKNFSRQNPDDFSEMVDLNASVATAMRLAGNIISKATDRLETNLAENLPPVRGSSQRIEQVLVNLLINACHALPDKEKGITISTSLDEAGRLNMVKIRDQGVGIPLEVQAQILDPFFTTKRNSGGTGLGLSVSARILKEHGGDLAFSSSPGEGTTMTLTFPTSQEDKG